MFRKLANRSVWLIAVSCLCFMSSPSSAQQADAIAKLFLSFSRTIGNLFQLSFDLFELFGHIFADLGLFCFLLDQVMHLLFT